MEEFIVLAVILYGIYMIVTEDNSECKNSKIEVCKVVKGEKWCREYTNKELQKLIKKE